MTSNCPSKIVPSKEAIADVLSIKEGKPALYDYVGAIGRREPFIARGCK